MLPDRGREGTLPIAMAATGRGREKVSSEGSKHAVDVVMLAEQYLGHMQTAGATGCTRFPVVGHERQAIGWYESSNSDTTQHCMQHTLRLGSTSWCRCRMTCSCCCSCRRCLLQRRQNRHWRRQPGLRRWLGALRVLLCDLQQARRSEKGREGRAAARPPLAPSPAPQPSQLPGYSCASTAKSAPHLAPSCR